jgi:alkylation response protein AidB-like acyl-CoA dehydrogenase
MPDVLRHRHHDYSLTVEQAELRDAFDGFFEKHVDMSRVRAAEPLGFDPVLWDELRGQRLTSMGLPENAGGDGADLVDLALVVEQAGRRATPAPVVEAMVAARALVRFAPDHALMDRVREGISIATIAPGHGSRRLIPAGAIAEMVLGRHEDHLVLLPGPTGGAVPNLACAPLSWGEFGGGRIVGEADAFEPIEREWEILTAAALVGVGQSVLDMGIRYAQERFAFGRPIGSFQAIAHPLVDAACAVTGARRLTWRAAWFAEHEPDAVGALAISALMSAAEAAEKAAATAIHTQGGFGLTLESDAHLFYRRAKGWALVAGGRPALLRKAADHVHLASRPGAA